MRDFERLEELSGTVAAGLAANNVIWAVDQAMAGAELDEEAKQSLHAGGDILKLIADPEAAGATPRRTAQRLLGSEVAQEVHEAVSEQVDEGEIGTYLTGLAEVLNQLAGEDKAELKESDIVTVLKIFSVIGDAELAHANSIIRTRREPTQWLRPTTTSSSS